MAGRADLRHYLSLTDRLADDAVLGRCGAFQVARARHRSRQPPARCARLAAPRPPSSQTLVVSGVQHVSGLLGRGGWTSVPRGSWHHDEAGDVGWQQVVSAGLSQRCAEDGVNLPDRGEEKLTMWGERRRGFDISGSEAFTPSAPIHCHATAAASAQLVKAYIQGRPRCWDLTWTACPPPGWAAHVSARHSIASSGSVLATGVPLWTPAHTTAVKVQGGYRPAVIGVLVGGGLLVILIVGAEVLEKLAEWWDKTGIPAWWDRNLHIVWLVGFLALCGLVGWLYTVVT